MNSLIRVHSVYFYGNSILEYIYIYVKAIISRQKYKDKG